MHFFTTALPDWRMRGGGTLAWYGKTVRWVHVGSVVPSVNDVVNRLQAAGSELDQRGGTTAHRQSVCFMQGSDIQFEFVEYKTQDAALRNACA